MGNLLARFLARMKGAHYQENNKHRKQLVRLDNESCGKEYRVLIIHNRYINRGGEDSVVDDEYALLKSRGHDVALYLVDNKDLATINPVVAASETIWSLPTWKKLNALISSFRPDIIHIHNFFPRISPSIFWAASSHMVPTVMTLHNFRYACAQGMFLHKGRVCESCAGRLSLRGVVRRCYRGSFLQSLCSVGSFSFHKMVGTFRNKVTLFIALSDFGRRKFITCGLPADKLTLKPNFVDVQWLNSWKPRRGGLFVGRLSPEKGVDTLLEALKSSCTSRIKVIGDGPDNHAVANCPQVEFLGWKSSDEVYKLMCSVSYLIMPSIWYETFGRTVIEAFACGLPVIASRIGSLAEIIEDGRTGFLFEPGSARDLAEKILWAESHPEEMLLMGKEARKVYEEKYTPDKNYEQLIAIYTRAIQSCSHPQPRL